MILRKSLTRTPLWAALAILIALFPYSMALASQDGEVAPPPGVGPTRVAVGFYLLDLLDVEEPQETFTADAYLSFRWHDQRLAFQGHEQKRLLEDAVGERFETIWSPQIELVNTSESQITNQRLEIFPDGEVVYILGVSANFRTNLDLHRFPFDSQHLAIRIESFMWNEDSLRFVVDEDRLGCSPDTTIEGMTITRTGAHIGRRELEGWGGGYSQFVGDIHVKRKANFYLWTVFVPVTLIFLISCTGFVVHIESFQDRINISLAALLACIATQFAMSFNLPKISYLTVIDQIFLATYLCIGLGVLTSTIQAVFLRQNRRASLLVDRVTGVGLPVIFLALLILWTS